MSIDEVNTKVAKMTIFAWFVGLSWCYWQKDTSTLTILDWLVLVIPGTFAVSILIGGGVAALLGVLTKIATGSMYNSAKFYSLGVLISPVLTFVAAGVAVDWLA